MGIFRTTDPTAFDDVDGIIINESAPAPNVAGVAANVAILVGQFTDGPFNELTEVGSMAEMAEIFGGGNGFTALKNKKFGRLKIIRVEGSGLAGAVLDSDYETAIAVAEQQGAGNVIFLDEYNDTRNGYLKAHVQVTQDKMCIVCGPEEQTIAEVIADVADYRDTEGRVIYAYPWVQTTIAGVPTMTNPASWLASIISQTAPNIDPAYAKNTGFMYGATGLKKYMSQAQFIQLKDAGVCGFELDADLGGIKPKSGVVTQIVDTSKVMILRRRMADFLTNSAAKFLKNYQNAVNSKENRTLVKGALQAFVTSLEQSGILPKDSEVVGGKAKLIDTESLNTNDSIAAGMFKILWYQRIYSSMRYIVLNAQIGESVVVTES
jgi:hypothetical protein